MKKIAVLTALFLSSFNLMAQNIEAIDQLSSLIKPGVYKGSFNGEVCVFEFATTLDRAKVSLFDSTGSIHHQFADHDGIVFEEYRNDFMSNYILRTNDVTVYSYDTFRFIKNEDKSYVVIEKMFINNRVVKTQKIECEL